MVQGARVHGPHKTDGLSMAGLPLWAMAHAIFAVFSSILRQEPGRVAWFSSSDKAVDTHPGSLCSWEGAKKPIKSF